MSSEINEEEIKAEYAALSDFQLKAAFHKIREIPNARTNIEALTKMSVVLTEFEKRGIKTPTPSNVARAAYQAEEPQSAGVSIGQLLIGIVLIVGGIAASAATDRIFYGAVIVGLIMVVKSFF